MVFANGPVSVCNNRFSAQITGPSSFDRLAGAVLLMNLGSGVQTSAPTGLFARGNHQARRRDVIFRQSNMAGIAKREFCVTDYLYVGRPRIRWRTIEHTRSPHVFKYLAGREDRACDRQPLQGAGKRRRTRDQGLFVDGQHVAQQHKR